MVETEDFRNTSNASCLYKATIPSRMQQDKMITTEDCRGDGPCVNQKIRIIHEESASVRSIDWL